MKRLLAVTLLAPVLAVGASVASAGSASAAGLCITYDINIKHRPGRHPVPSPRLIRR